MHAAVGFGHADVCEVLLSAHANPNARTRWPGLSPLHMASFALSGDAVRELAAGRADVEARMFFPLGFTPLQSAAFFNNADAGEALIEVRADSSARCRALVGAGTALDLATKWNRRAVLPVLAGKHSTVGHSQDVVAVAIDGEYGVTGAHNGTATVGSRDSGTQRRVMKGHTQDLSLTHS